MPDDDMPIGIFTEAAARGIFGMYQDYSAHLKGGSGGEHAQAHSPFNEWAKPSFFKIASKVSDGIWLADKCSADGTVDDPAISSSLRVVGPEPKSGLIMHAAYDYMELSYVAHGYPHRVLDFGTGAESPYVVESGLLKLKTKTTANGYTWTAEKITLSNEEC